MKTLRSSNVLSPAWRGSQCKHPVVKDTAPTVKTGTKWKKQFNMHKPHYSIRDIIGRIQRGRAAFGSGDSWDEATRRTAAVSQAKQGHSVTSCFWFVADV